MKIKFNIEIGKKDGLKDSHLNCNAEVDITPEELKEILLNATEKSNVTSEKNEIPAVPVPDESAKYTVAVCSSDITSEDVYAVRYNKTGNYCLMVPSLFHENIFIMNKIDDEVFNACYANSIKKFSTNVLEFLNGKEVKEV